MQVIGTIYLVALVSFFVGVAASPGQHFRGNLAATLALANIFAGLVLAIGSL